ncbi:MAG: DUF4124 domain-containing protein [Cocleimonas sp.]
MFNKLTAVFLLLFSFSLNADVVKWVDSEGKTHYSNKAPKKNKKYSQKIKFTQYKKPEKIEVNIVPAVDWSKDFTQIDNSYQSETQAKSRQPKLRKKKEPTIVELRAQCDIAREKRLAPARAEAVEECIEKNERQTKNVVAFCERFNRTFGDEQHGGVSVHYGGVYRNTSGSSRQRLFHNILECRRLYRAEDKRSRLNRGYSN